MFGYVTGNWKELNKEQKDRYSAVYCGICRRLQAQFGGLSRLGLSYDMAFLAILLMSLYEPAETAGKGVCGLHPLKPRNWVDNEYVRYSADMNGLLAYYNCMDNWEDDRKLSSKFMAGVYQKNLERIEESYPRQTDSVRQCLAELHQLEEENCPNPDQPAGVFGKLMGQILVYREDMWSQALSNMGDSLGRFIYLMDAVLDYRKDKRRGNYNPLLAADSAADPKLWEEYLVLEMASVTTAFEKLPLVQDKALLDNILYSGVWMNYRSRKKTDKEGHHD